MSDDENGEPLMTLMTSMTSEVPQDEFARRSCDVRVPAVGRVPAGPDLPNYTVERAQALDGSTFLLYRDPDGEAVGSRMTALARSGQLELPRTEYERMSAALFEREEHETGLDTTFVIGAHLAAHRWASRRPKQYPALLRRVLCIKEPEDNFSVMLNDPLGVGKRLLVLDLYCGIGGLSLGLQAGGFRHCAGVDCWKTAVGSYIHNRCGAWGLLRKLRVESLNDWIAAIQSAFAPFAPSGSCLPLVLVGGPPCQPFSKRGIRMGCADEREGLTNFLYLVVNVKPIAFLVENVPEMVENDLFRQWLDEKLTTVRDEYEVRIALHQCEDHRVPQQRKRVSITGYFRAAWPGGVPDEAHPTHAHDRYTPWDAWCEEPESFWNGPTPNALRLEPISLRSRQRIATRTQTSGLVVANRTAGTVVTTCTSGNSWHRMALVPCSEAPLDEFDDMERDHVTYGGLRALQPRHIQLLQGFPSEFVLYGSYRAQGHMLGNAVPPMLAYDLACSLLHVLQSAILPDEAFDVGSASERLRHELQTRTR